MRACGGLCRAGCGRGPIRALHPHAEDEHTLPACSGPSTSSLASAPPSSPAVDEQALSPPQGPAGGRTNPDCPPAKVAQEPRTAMVRDESTGLEMHLGATGQDIRSPAGGSVTSGPWRACQDREDRTEATPGSRVPAPATAEPRASLLLWPWAGAQPGTAPAPKGRSGDAHFGPTGKSPVSAPLTAMVPRGTGSGLAWRPGAAPRPQ